MTRKQMMGLVVAAGVAVLLSACSQQQIASFVSGKTSHHPDYWVVQADTSGSTAPQAKLGGTYEQEIMAALAQAGRAQATVYTGAIDGNGIGDAAWLIDGVPLSSSAGGGNARLAESARVQKGRGDTHSVRRLLASRLPDGSDILGELAPAGRALQR